MILAFAENTIQLVPDGTLLLHLVIVVVMVAILNRTLFGPINKVLEEREAQTSGKASQAHRTRAELKSRLNLYERRLREARSAAYQRIDLERTEALRQREQAVAQVKEDVRSWSAAQRSEIEQQAVEARKVLTRESSESALKIGSQVLHRPVSGAEFTK